MKAKYPNGTRVMVKVGHQMWGNDELLGMYTKDIKPELTKDFATVMYTYGEKSETDHKYSQGEIGYQSYCLKFDSYHQISWFEESSLIPIYYYEGKPYRILHEGKAKATSIINTAFKIMWPEMFIEPDVEKKLEEAEDEFAEANNGSKWIDVVIYEPLYAECDIRVCVKEKQDFYNNYKSTLDGHNTGT